MVKNFYNLPNSWNPGFAIPGYVMDEPPGRGTFTTTWLPRGTISQVPRDLGTSFNPGFVLPPSVEAEPYGQNPFTTAWIPRGTISQGVPEFGPNTPGGPMTPGRKILNRADANLGLGSLGDDTLGAGSAPSQIPTNPIVRYGQDAASWIMHSAARLPAAKRSDAVRALLDAIDPSLWGTVQNARTKLQRQGLSTPQALQQAIAASMATGMHKELVDVGTKALRGRRQTMPKTGHVALGAHPTARRRAKRQAMQALGFDWNPVHAITHVASTISGAIDDAVVGTKDAAVATAGAIKDASVATAHFVADGVDTLGGLACKVIGSDAYKAAAQVAATAAGGPAAGQAAGTGVTVERSVCGTSVAKVPVAPPPPPKPSLPSWVMPAAIGVGIFGVGALLLRRK